MEETGNEANVKDKGFFPLLLKDKGSPLFIKDKGSPLLGKDNKGFPLLVEDNKGLPLLTCRMDTECRR